MNQIHIQIIMPTAVKLDDMVESVFLPGIEGDFEVMYNHTQVITRLRPGAIIVHKGGKQEFFAMHDAFVTVEDNKILILSECCENKSEIDIARAKAAKDRAEKRMQSISTDPNVDYNRAHAALVRSLARLNTCKG